MDDLISRGAAIEAFDDERVDRNYGDVSPESVIKVIESIPAVDAVPVVSAHYVEGSVGEWYCSNCKRIDEKYSVARYCWYCGAKMGGENK